MQFSIASNRAENLKKIIQTQLLDLNNPTKNPQLELLLERALLRKTIDRKLKGLDKSMGILSGWNNKLNDAIKETELFGQIQTLHKEGFVFDKELEQAQNQIQDKTKRVATLFPIRKKEPEKPREKVTITYKDNILQIKSSKKEETFELSEEEVKVLRVYYEKPSEFITSREMSEAVFGTDDPVKSGIRFRVGSLGAKINSIDPNIVVVEKRGAHSGSRITNATIIWTPTSTHIDISTFKPETDQKRLFGLEIAYVASSLKMLKGPDITPLLAPHRQNFIDLFANKSKKETYEYKSEMKKRVMAYVTKYAQNSTGLINEASGDNIPQILEWLYRNRERIIASKTIVVVVPTAIPESNLEDRDTQAVARIKSLIDRLPQNKDNKLMDSHTVTTLMGLRRSDLIDAIEDKGILQKNELSRNGHHYSLTPDQVVRIAYYIKYGKRLGVDRKSMDNLFEAAFQKAQKTSS